MATQISGGTRVRGALLGIAVCDALGGPVEFRRRGTFPRVTSMLPNDNFDLPPGCFTDDTSMALCLAHSLLANGGEHDTMDQVRRYIAWFQNGYMSSVGRCFDIGNATSLALTKWSQALRATDHLNPGSPEMAAAVQGISAEVIQAFSKEQFCGNGSLMRVLPTALVARDEDTAVKLAKLSSQPTHPHQRCSDACAMYSAMVYAVLEGASKDDLVLKLSHLVADPDVDSELQERLSSYKSISDWEKQRPDTIWSTGYVVDSIEASLWAFFTTHTFEEGAICAVNLGDDADTVAAIYGGLAGAFYGFDAIPESWLKEMKSMNLLNDIVDQILAHRLT